MTETKTTMIKRDEVINDTLVKIREFQKTGAIKLPSDYSSENALNSAYLILQEVKDKDKKPALEVCTKASVANALFDMVTRGLNPAKKQCYFIVKGGKLCMDPSYFGNVATAKRVGMKDINAEVVYKDDEFTFEIDSRTGRKQLIKHVQSLDNIDFAKIKGAYAIATMPDDSTNMTLMTILQIRKAWLQGAAGGNSGAHNNFTDEMCKKTVINRACKLIINSSDDGYLFEGKESEETEKEETQDGSLKETLDFQEAEVVETIMAVQEAEKEAVPVDGSSPVATEPPAKEEPTKPEDTKVAPELDLKVPKNKPKF